MRAVGLLLVVCAATWAAEDSAVKGLAMSYGEKGIQTLQFDGVTLADVGKNPGDEFSIRHMRVTDLKGNVQSQYGW